MKRLLSFGLEAYPVEGYELFHLPLIEVLPLPWESSLMEPLKEASHLLFTSKTAISLFPFVGGTPVIAVGKKSAQKAEERGYRVVGVAREETQEGVLELLSLIEPSSLFWPCSSLARKNIELYCTSSNIPLAILPLYTIGRRLERLPALGAFDALFFSSPSTVDAFFALSAKLPEGIELLTMGRVTREYLELRLRHLKEAGLYL